MYNHECENYCDLTNIICKLIDVLYPVKSHKCALNNANCIAVVIMRQDFLKVLDYELTKIKGSEKPEVL